MHHTEINQAILKGIKAAFYKFEDWTAGSWLIDYGCESVIQVQVASELANARPNPKYSICLEPWFQEILDLEEARAAGKGKWPKEISWNKRADIAVFNSRNRPIAVIEVKRKWVTKYCVEDLKRIAALIKHGGSQRSGQIRSGFLELYVHKKGKLKVVRTEITKLEDTIRAEWKNRFGLKYDVTHTSWEKPDGDDDYAHAAVSIRVHA